MQSPRTVITWEPKISLSLSTCDRFRVDFLQRVAEVETSQGLGSGPELEVFGAVCKRRIF